MNTPTLHPILGTDKCDPAFCVMVTKENPEDLHVYFGLALLERVNSGKDSFQYKYLVGRLYNAGFKRKKLIETFDHSLSTIRRWGDAVISGSLYHIERAFSGQGARGRLTQEIENFIRIEFRRIYPEDSYSYSKRILQRIEDVFNETFSSETLRPIFNEEKAALTEVEEPPAREIIDALTGSEAGKKEVEMLISHEGEHSTAEDLSTYENVKEQDSQTSATKSKICDYNQDLSVSKTNIRKYSIPTFDMPQPLPERFHINHLGLSLFLPILFNFNFDERMWNQWMSSILLGAVNIEQSGELDYHALEFLLAQETISSTINQHIVLGKLATSDNTIAVWRYNAELCNASSSPYFYYDPHSIPYSGMKNILKGWCGSAGRITKTYYQDFIHTADGDPVYFGFYDNYLDLRERFADNVDVFLSEIVNLKSAVFIVDRGIYGKDAMIGIVQRGHGLVTWEKDYKRDAWDDEAGFKSFVITRSKNRAADIKTWKINYQEDELWNRIPGFHRIIVRITPPGDNPQEMEVAILTSGHINKQEAVYGMLNRWIQENDFRYLIRHFGINQITSYKAVSYKSLEDVLAEKEVRSDCVRLLQKIKTKQEEELKKLLMKKHFAENMKEKERLRIKELTEKIRLNKKEIEAAEKRVSKAEKLIEEGTVRLNTDKKALFDALRVTARNMFYLSIRQFRPLLDNYRNDHQILRELSRAHGYITFNQNNLVLELAPTRNYQPAQRKAICEFLDIVSKEINDNAPGKLPVRFTLAANKKSRYPAKNKIV